MLNPISSPTRFSSGLLSRVQEGCVSSMFPKAQPVDIKAYVADSRVLLGEQYSRMATGGVWGGLVGLAAASLSRVVFPVARKIKSPALTLGGMLGGAWLGAMFNSLLNYKTIMQRALVLQAKHLPRLVGQNN